MISESKYKGAIKLSAIGDALGWITEFEKHNDSLKQKYGVSRIEQFFDWEKTVGGRFFGFTDHIKAGSYSDDTQLLLSVARSIKGNGRIDNEYFSKVELKNWLNYSRGAGKTVKAAADKISRKSAFWYNNFFKIRTNKDTLDYRQSGANGAAMRILPIVLANVGNIEIIKEDVFSNSIITHGHPRAILGAMLYGYAVNQILIYRSEDFSWENYITQIGVDFPIKFDLSFINRTEIQKWLSLWNSDSNSSFEALYAETVTEAQNQLRLVFQSLKYNYSVEDTLRRLGCFDHATKGSGISTVNAGIYLACKYSDKPKEAVLAAVNSLGSDTDSIAAFTGGLIGALHGQGIIPDKWKTVQDMEYLDKVADHLLNISEDSLADYRPDIYKTSEDNLRSIEDIKSDNYSIGEEIVFSPLGKGTISFIDRQDTITKGKYNLIIHVDFTLGQSCIFSKLFDKPINNTESVILAEKLHELNKLGQQYLEPAIYANLKTYTSFNKNLSIELVNLLIEIISAKENK